ncbi:hypothetical protein [Cryobacterium sp. Y62]|uniref:hypothetical protein n=1 Tax=Cryobacterium sp. Y62 TaxID=2048284 RepID=UPI000CE46E92|nr:hypothetical protein [Cryobacterium sp. Y62]
MSAQTKRDLEAAIAAHHRSETEGNDLRENAVVIDWVVGYTISNIVDGTVGYTNGYDSCDTNPNAQVHLAQWTSNQIADLLDPDDED